MISEPVNPAKWNKDKNCNGTLVPIPYGTQSMSPTINPNISAVQQMYDRHSYYSHMQLNSISKISNLTTPQVMMFTCNPSVHLSTHLTL